MSIETTEMDTKEEEPIYYVPKRVSRISDFASVLSWIVLVGFLADVIVQVISLQAQLSSQGVTLASLVREPSLYSYFFINVGVPLLTGLGLFALLQAAAAGLNMLLDMDYKARED